MTAEREPDFDELAAVVAHELATPLTVIGSAASLLDRDADREHDPEEVDAIVGTIHRNVEIARLVVEGLRTREPDGGSIELEREPTDLADLARTVVGDLSDNVLSRHRPEVDGLETLVAEVDPRRVRQVLFNLLSNAAKYSPPGRAVRVVVEADDRAARLVVRDRGHGVAPDDAERIFGKWSRGDEDAAGLGLGLHLSRAIARAHGGDLRLEQPEDGDGAVFVLELPR